MSRFQKMMSELARICYRKYQRNVALADVMREQLSDHDGWNVVVRFYAALHLLNTYLVDKGTVDFEIASSDHEQRRKAMQRCPELRDAPNKYRALKELSEYVRYQPDFEFTPRHQKEAEIFLAKIISIVDPKIKMK